MSKPRKRHLRPINLGKISYSEGLKAQQKFRLLVRQTTSDYLLLQEHLPTITLGKNASTNDLYWSESELVEQSIELVSTDRGGKLTAHNPGQLVGYPIFDMEAHGLRTREFVSKIEDALQKTLASFQIEAEIFGDRPGLWVSGKKIAALGFRIEDGISSHGFAINIKNCLSIYKGFKPCGFSSHDVTNMEQFLGDKTPSLGEVAALVTELIRMSFNQTIDTRSVLK